MSIIEVHSYCSQLRLGWNRSHTKREITEGSKMMSVIMNFLLPVVTSSPISLLNSTGSTQDSQSSTTTGSLYDVVNDSLSLDIFPVTSSLNASHEDADNVDEKNSPVSSLRLSSLAMQSSRLAKKSLLDLLVVHSTPSPSSFYSSIGEKIIINDYAHHHQHESNDNVEKMTAFFSNSSKSMMIRSSMLSSSLSFVTTVSPSILGSDEDHEDLQTDFIDDILGWFGASASSTNKVSEDSFLSVSNIEALGLVLPTLIIMLFTIIGNGLVIGAIFTYRPLKSVQNMYLVSLAVADIAVATFVMPFNVIYTLRSRWDFGLVTCKIWLTCDILCCTASILNLCAIALDRYQAIHDPINYAQKRTLRRVLIGVALVWIISALISIPPLLGWNDWPDEFSPTTPCTLTSERGFVIYSSSGSFFIPLVIMSIVYVKIYVATRRRLRSRAKSAATKLTNFKSNVVNTTVVPETSDPDHQQLQHQDHNHLETNFGGNNCNEKKRSKSLVSFSKKSTKNIKQSSNDSNFNNNNHNNNNRNKMTITMRKTGMTGEAVTTATTSGTSGSKASASSDSEVKIVSVLKSSKSSSHNKFSTPPFQELPSTSSSSGDHQHSYSHSGYDSILSQGKSSRNPSSVTSFLSSKKRDKSSSHQQEVVGVSRVKIAIEKNSTSRSGVCSDPSDSSTSSSASHLSRDNEGKQNRSEQNPKNKKSSSRENDPLMLNQHPQQRRAKKTTTKATTNKRNTSPTKSSNNTTTGRSTSAPSASLTTNCCPQEYFTAVVPASILMREGSYSSNRSKKFSTSSITNEQNTSQEEQEDCHDHKVICDSDDDVDQNRMTCEEYHHHHHHRLKSPSTDGGDGQKEEEDSEGDYDEEYYEENEDDFDVEASHPLHFKRSSTTEAMTNGNQETHTLQQNMNRCNSSPHRLSVPSSVKMSVRTSSSSHEESSKGSSVPTTESSVKSKGTHKLMISEVESSCGNSSIPMSTGSQSVLTQVWEEKQRISLSRERKAARVLGIVMG